MINFGIDLGTTNSAIAKFVKGQVEIYKSPTDWKETIPSVVGFKKDKIIVGAKAKELLQKAPDNVKDKFKRKMGTSESYKIKSLNQSKTPIELSSFVLKELKTFVQSGEKIEWAVITIPASFDTIQSNATKEAGIQAGFKQVVLLQEPIAASLAYANKHKEKELADGQWLVYDLGGGTFDVALVRIKDGEMKILDHEGDNFLGGSDFDSLIVEKLIIPKLENKYTFKKLQKEMESAAGKYNSKYYILLRNAEEAKILLSAKSSAEITIDYMQDDNGQEIDEEFTITRSEFQEIINEKIDETIEMIKKILVRKSLKAEDIQFTLMVGGSTYIPYVRQRVEEILQIPVNCEIDPTTAVVIGAAYYAGTKQKSIDESIKKEKKKAVISIKMAYQKVTKEKEEFFSAKVTGNTDGLFYRITREDGGFDTSLKKLSQKINEDLPLVENSYNFFKLSVFDEQNNPIETDAEPIGIAQGKYGIAGQPLPNDICLEVDDLENNTTTLNLYFLKNSVLPLKKTETIVLNRTVVKGSGDFLRVNVLEGPHTSLPEANKSIGYMAVSGKQLKTNVSKGSDIEITLEISESRDLAISAYLNMADQEFKEIFNPTQRHLPVELLVEEVETLEKKINKEIEEATEREDYESAKELNNLKGSISEISTQSHELTSDDVTDKRYQIEDKKRKIAQEIDNATKDKRVQEAKKDYIEVKQKCLEIIESDGNDEERKLYDDIVAQEQTFLSSSSPIKIREKADELMSINLKILWRTPAFLIGMFKRLVQDSHKFNNQEQAKSLIDAGKFALESQNYDRLGEIVSGLLNLLPKAVQKEIKSKIGF